MSRRNRPEADFIWSTGIHLADLLCLLVGPLKLVGSRQDGGKSLFKLVGQHDLHGGIELWPTADRTEEAVYIGASGWTIKIVTGTHGPWQVSCLRERALEVDAVADAASPDFVRNGTADETASFLRGVLHDEPLTPSVTDAMPGTELAAAMQES
jgi:hypothetical protein